MATNTTDPMAALMADDDGVSALSELGVKDIYVRTKLMEALCEHFTSATVPGGWDAPLFEEGEDTLRTTSPEGVRMFVIKAANHGILSRGFADVAHQNRSEDFVLAAWDYMTKEDTPDEKRVRIARRWLADHLRGCLGMPTDAVIRDAMRNQYLLDE